MTPMPSALAGFVLFSETATKELYNFSFECELVILKSINLTDVLQLKLQQFSRSFSEYWLKENYKIPGFFQDFSLGVV